MSRRKSSAITYLFTIFYAELGAQGYCLAAMPLQKTLHTSHLTWEDSPTVLPSTAQGAKFAPLLGWTAICSLAFLKPLIATTGYALHNDSASHLLLIPFIVGFLLYVEHRSINRVPLELANALVFALPATLLAILALKPPAQLRSGNIPLAISILAFVLFLIAGFVAIYGRRTATRLSFSLAFLLFFVPLPDPILNRIIYFLQVGSADIAEWLFDLTGTPALRQGFVFHLPTVNIEVE